MRRLRLRPPARAAVAVAAGAAALASLADVAYADGASLFRRQSAAPSPDDSAATREAAARDEASVTWFGNDPEILERMTRLLRDINGSKLSKQAFDLMRRQEETRLKELEAEKLQFAMNEKLRDIVYSIERCHCFSILLVNERLDQQHAYLLSSIHTRNSCIRGFLHQPLLGRVKA
ncbi:hypothetical protein ACP70R_018342 [Stipagrostis hirtigluma subsp. patula]